MAAATVTMLAPTPGSKYQTRGAAYTADAAGYIYNVATGGTDILDLWADGCVITGPAANVGTANTGITAVEYGDGYTHTTLLTIGSGIVLPAIAGGAALGVGKLLYTLPVGAHIIDAAHQNVAITQTQGHITADTPVVGLGTTIATGAVSVLSGTAAFQNIMAGTAAADCNGTPTVKTALATASPFGLVSEIGGAKGIYVNAAASWAASGDAAAVLSGTVLLRWKTLA